MSFFLILKLGTVDEVNVLGTCIGHILRTHIRGLYILFYISIPVLVLVVSLVMYSCSVDKDGSVTLVVGMIEGKVVGPVQKENTIKALSVFLYIYFAFILYCVAGFYSFVSVL